MPTTPMSPTSIPPTSIPPTSMSPTSRPPTSRPPATTPPATTASAPGASSLAGTPIRPGATSTWTVRRGDHLWGIAERTLATRRAADPSDDDVRRYWVELIATNRGRLADPANPDLIFAGQVLVLPPG
jgi:nucleoid-associated protein YgaU